MIEEIGVVAIVRFNRSEELVQVAQASAVGGVWVIEFTMTKPTPHRAPRANAICERFVGGVRREYLDDLPILSDGQLFSVIKEYVGCFNRARPHQGISQEIPEQMGNTGGKNARGRLFLFQS